MPRAARKPDQPKPLPPLLAWMVEALGAAKAFQACMRLGGQRHYVPAKPNGRGRGLLGMVFSEADMAALSARFGGEYPMFPVGREFCAHVLYWVHGYNAPAIGRALHCSEKRVREMLRAARPPAYLSKSALASDEKRRAAARPAHLVQRDIFQKLGLLEHKPDA